jgi:hypothetical protein
MSDRSVARGFRSPELRDAFHAALAAGWRYRFSGGGHVILLAPDGTTTVSLSVTAQHTGRSVNNALADLRRAGLEF